MGAQALASLVALQHLILAETAITDLGVQALTSLVALQHLDLAGTGIRTWECKHLLPWSRCSTWT